MRHLPPRPSSARFAAPRHVRLTHSLWLFDLRNCRELRNTDRRRAIQPVARVRRAGRGVEANGLASRSMRRVAAGHGVARQGITCNAAPTDGAKMLPG